MPSARVLAVFAGLPGSGKSTLAARVGKALPAPVLAVDEVDRVLHDHRVSEPTPGVAAYGIVAALAAQQLALGHSVIVDAVSPVAAARDLWRDVAERAGAPLRVVEVLCGDEAEHRRRIEAREGHPIGIDWDRVQRRRAEYEPYPGPLLVVDTSVAGDPVPPVLTYLRDLAVVLPHEPHIGVIPAP
jgi:predicted kinase